MITIAGGILLALAIIAGTVCVINVAKFLWLTFWNGILGMPTAEERYERSLRPDVPEDVVAARFASRIGL